MEEGFIKEVDYVPDLYSDGMSVDFLLDSLEDYHGFESAISYPVHSKETLEMMNDHAGNYVKKLINIGLIKVYHLINTIDIGDINPSVVPFIPFADPEVKYNSEWKLNAKNYTNINISYEGLPDYNDMEHGILTVGVITRMTVNL